MSVDDFDERIGRRGSASVKWDEADRLFGGKELLPLWVADMDFRVPDAVTQALLKRVGHGIYGYTTRSDTYLEAVRNWMQKRHGWAVQKDWLCHSPGVVTALNLLIDGLTEPGDKVLIQPPVYPPFRKAVQNQGRRVVTNPLVNHDGAYTMDFEDLERKFTDPAVRLMILCSPHNPVGRVWTAQELRRVAELAKKYDVLVVSDEIHGDLVLDNRAQIPFASLPGDAADRCIVCTAPSKTFNLAGLQISNIIIKNPVLRKRYNRQLARFGLSEANTLGETAAEAAYRGGASWLDRLLIYIKDNADMVERCLKRELPQLRMSPLEGTYLGWIDCRRLGLGPEQLRRLFVDHAHLAVNPGDSFGSEGEGFVRINLACPRSLLEEALSRLKRAIDG
jgi:cystathionine beta-lyase